MGNKEQHPAWQWLLDHQAVVDRIVKRACRGAYYLCDELTEEVYDRVQRVYDTFDGSHDVPRDAYMFSTLKWYLWKWMNANYERLGRSVSFSVLFDGIKRGEDDTTTYSSYAGHSGFSSSSLPVLAVEDSTFKRLVAWEEVQKILSSVGEYDRRLLVMRHLVGMQLKDIAELVGVTTQTVCRDCFTAEEEARRVAGYKS